MNAATWRLVGRAFPGPVVLAVWVLVTVPVPLIFFEGTHRWEEDPKLSTALWWTVGAVPGLAAVVAAKWTWRTGQRRTASGLLAPVVAATLISAVLVGATLAVYRWVVPLDGAARWWSVLLGSVPLAICGAAVGHLFKPGRVRRGPQIRGAVGSLIHWPLVAIWLLGAIPGLLIIAEAVRRRTRRRSVPVASPSSDETRSG